MSNLPDSFINKVEVTDGCWLWKASKNRKRYGQFQLKRKQMLAHRFVWMCFYGSIPETMQVCHKCDNPSCVNPSHLFLGTNRDNVRDRNAKGRQAIGERHGLSKLTQEKVSRIRELHSQGAKQHDISVMFGITQSNVSCIVLYKSWKKEGA
jgi:hypothetical protein